MGPGHDDVVRPHAVGDVVAAQRGGVGQAFGDAAFGGHDVDFGVAIVLAGKCQGFAIRREAGEHLEAVVAGELARHAAAGGHGIQIAGIGEDDLIFVNGREAQQAGFILRKQGRSEAESNKHT